MNRTLMFVTLLSLCAFAIAERAEAVSLVSIIDVDFEETTPGANGTATAANLNQEDSGGTWAANDIQESQVRSGGGNQVLNVDRGSYDYDLGSFVAAPLDMLELSYDTYIQRTTGSADSKKNFFFGADTDGDEVFRLILTTDGSANPTNGRLKYVDASGTEHTVIDGLNSEGGDGFTNSRLQNVRLVFNPGGYDIYVEGIFQTTAPYRNPVGPGIGNVDDLGILSFLGSGGSDTTAAGAFYDNISISVEIPEPATAALGLLALGGLGAVTRRRRA